MAPLCGVHYWARAKSSNRSQLQFESRARPSRFSPPTWTGAGQNKNRNEKAKNQVLGGGTILKDLEITFKAFFFLFEIPSWKPFPLTTRSMQQFEFHHSRQAFLKNIEEDYLFSVTPCFLLCVVSVFQKNLQPNIINVVVGEWTIMLSLAHTFFSFKFFENGKIKKREKISEIGL